MSYSNPLHNDPAVNKKLLKIANLTDQQWAQSSLPSAMGGLGLRCAIDHAPIAHAVSLLAAKPLLDGLLGEDVEDPRLPQPLLDQIC